jgi:citrate lyase subunit gamma (acyl carrier protein)
MKLVKEAVAGTLESSDLLVKIAPGTGGDLDIIVQSEVIKQFGKQIRLTVKDTLSKLEVTEGLIIIEDKGALDCVIRARVQAAVLRGTDAAELNWGELA